MNTVEPARDTQIPRAEALGLLRALQQADSFFPSGGTAFSWGVEPLIAERAVDLQIDLSRFLVAQLEHRWATFDRGVVLCAHRSPDVASMCALDAHVETMLLPRELREGSRRAGASLLDVHHRMGTPGATELRTAIRSSSALGHLPVVQGWVWRGLQLSELDAQAISAHAFCIAILGAAVRMGVVGHIQSQRALSQAQERIEALLRQPAPSLDECYSYTPQLDIASMRHETQAVRLFVN